MKTVLSIGAHPDDIEIGCGGTEALLKDQGYSIIHLVVTSGGQGSLSLPVDQLIQKREREALESAKIIGVCEVIFLRLPDGLTSFSIEDKIKLIGIIRSIAPDIIFTHSKDDHFPDHQVVRSITESAVKAAAGPWYPQAGKNPHQVKSIYGYEVWHPISSFQTAVDITERWSEKELR